MKCLNCDSENATDNVFCTKCGAQLSSPAGFCPQCRSPLPPDVKFCHICGTKIPDKSTVNMDFDDQPVPLSRMKKKHRIWIGVLAVLLIVVIAALTTFKKGINPFVITDKNLIGLWSTEGPSGELVDPDTGYATGSVYNGTWYLFRSDGTYRFVNIGSGNVISGIVECNGNYSVSDGKIYLTHVKESWYPNPARPEQKAAYKGKKVDDQTLIYRYIDGVDTLNVDEHNYFHRVAVYN